MTGFIGDTGTIVELKIEWFYLRANPAGSL